MRKGTILEGKKIVLFVGQLIERKGLDVIIKVADILDESYSFHFIGGNVDKNKEEIIKKYKKNNIYFHGVFPSDEVYNYMKLCDIFFMPSKKDIWGLVINEAMSQGCTILSSKQCIAASEMVVDGENGFVLDCNDSIGYADKISYLFSNVQLLDYMGKNNLNKMKNYTIEKMAEAYKNALEDYLKKI